MNTKRSASPIDQAAEQLRDIAMGVPAGELLGSEDDILRNLKVSRVTLRQAARLLERDGVLRVRRGQNGGYFSARPDVEMVERVVCAYLNTLGLDAKHTGSVATALWVQVLREAAAADPGAARAVAADLSTVVENLGPETTAQELATAEHQTRASLFKLIDGAYIELIFRINAAFARQKIVGLKGKISDENHRKFVRNWKKAKLLELDAVADGDVLQATIAALHERNVWASLSQVIED